MLKIGIFSLHEDLHAHLVRERLVSREEARCHLFDTNRLAGRPSLTWSTGSGGSRNGLVDIDGSLVDPRELDAIWWRRTGFKQEVPGEDLDPLHLEIVENDCNATLLGILLTRFEGRWISHPLATHRAENKLVQLAAAQKAGFRVPRTLASQDPRQIRSFCEELDNRVVVKPVKGTGSRPLFTRRLRPEHLESDERMTLAPALYQELIAGERHLRIQSFGDRHHAAAIESGDLDWRENLDVPIRDYEVGAELGGRIDELLARLDLRMGIIDCKVAEDGEIVWLEVNPQGQFLFLQGITGYPLAEEFAQFLVDEAGGHR